ncbi:TPA: hypothetical protein M8T80_003663 [Salmonella enterica subsp. enterica serovar Infantis]|nr:hypothetical protein [Salmonella enterica subsp. enterica serovar Infantis]HCD0612570.1 hypothetical protein [Salmonella enterica subsp. enterica serovar Infantis]
MNNKFAIIALTFISFNTSAQSPTTNWTSVLVGDYLNPKRGSELKISEPANGERWYFNGSLKGGYHTSETYHKYYSDIMFRVRGAKKLNDDYLFVADLRLDTKENYVRKNGQTVNHYNGMDDNTLIDQYRVGFESLTYGAFLYGKYTANTVPFFADIDDSVKGMYLTQGEGGGKNADKFMYKNHFDNNLFVFGSYDQKSHIWGFDIGYQSADVYSKLPDSHGVYFSMHNGQPMLEIGSFTHIYGNVNKNKNINSDTKYNRDSESLYTYSLSGYYQLANRHRFMFNSSYSKKEDENDLIIKRGYTKKGLGHSAVAGYQLYPESGRGFSPLLMVSYTEFSNSIIPQLQYWFSPRFKVWGAYSLNSGQPDAIKLEAKYSF